MNELNMAVVDAVSQLQPFLSLFSVIFVVSLVKFIAYVRISSLLEVVGTAPVSPFRGLLLPCVFVAIKRFKEYGTLANITEGGASVTV